MAGIEIKLEKRFIEVVRCKDCKHHKHMQDWCTKLEIATTGDWYCAEGERRTDDG